MATKTPERIAAKPECELTSAVGGPEVLNKEVTVTSPDCPADTKATAVTNGPLEDESLLGGLLTQLLDAGPQRGQASVHKEDYMFALLLGLAPRDHLEVMLMSQMAAVHVATLTAAGELARAQTFPQHDNAERKFNKLARTFVTQMEALSRYRTGGDH